MSSEPTSTISMRIRLRYPDVETFIDRYAANISSGGMFIQSRTPPEVGTLLRFELCLSSGTSVVRGEGRVVWIKSFDETRPSEPHGMGVRFTHLDEASQVMVERILAAKGERPSGTSGTGEVHALRAKAVLTQADAGGAQGIVALLEEADATLARLIEEAQLTPTSLERARARALQRVADQTVEMDELDRLLAAAPRVSVDRDSALAALRRRFSLAKPPAVRRARPASPLAERPAQTREERAAPGTDLVADIAPQAVPDDTGGADASEVLGGEEVTREAYIVEAADAHSEAQTAPAADRATAEPPPDPFDPSLLRAAARVARASAEHEERPEFDLSEASVPGQSPIEGPFAAAPGDHADALPTGPAQGPALTSAEWQVAADEWREGQPQPVDGAEELDVDDLEELEIEVDAPPVARRSAELSDFDREYWQQHPHAPDDFGVPDTAAMPFEQALAQGAARTDDQDEAFEDFSSFADASQPDEPTLLSAQSMQDPDMEDSAFDELASSAGPRHSAPSLDALVDELDGDGPRDDTPRERRRKKHTSDVFRRLFGKK